MPVKINGNILKNIQVNGADVKKVGVRGRPVFLKINSGAIGYVYTHTITGSATKLRPFFEIRSDSGVKHFTLGLKGKKIQGSGSSTEINLYTVVRMEVLDSSGYSKEKEYLIHIWGSNISSLHASMQSEDLTIEDNIINIETTAQGGMNILDISLEHDGNSLYVKVFGDSSGNYFSLTDPKTSWYVEGESGSPKYTVYAYGNVTNLNELTYFRGETPLEFL